MKNEFKQEKRKYEVEIQDLQAVIRKLEIEIEQLKNLIEQSVIKIEHLKDMIKHQQDDIEEEILKNRKLFELNSNLK